MNHFCDLHKIAFDRHEKDGRVWYSHKIGNVWCNEPKEVKQATPVKPTETREPVPQEIPSKQPDWDGIARGKVRNSVAVAFIPLIGQMPIDKEIAEVMETWVEWIMTSKTPESLEDVDLDLPSDNLEDK